MVNERDLKRRLPTEYSLGDDDWSFLCIAVDVLEPFFCLTKRFESREPRFAEVAASLHFLRDFVHRKRDIYSDGLANPEMSGPGFTGGSIFIGDQRPTLQPITPPNTQSELFANQPQRQRWQPTRHKEGASDEGITLGVDHGNSGGPVSFSDGQNLRALRASLTIAIGRMDKYIATLEDSPAYWAAMILHPCLKKRWIEKYLPEEQAQRITHGFEKFFDEEYNKPGPLVIQQASHSRSSYLVDEDFYDKRTSRQRTN
ncbi:hypothetical protein V3481_018492 [Fusarium oxysporum f. sp. vasinfectum]